jgi:hypothetical protein
MWQFAKKALAVPFPPNEANHFSIVRRPVTSNIPQVRDAELWRWQAVTNRQGWGFVQFQNFGTVNHSSNVACKSCHFVADNWLAISNGGRDIRDCCDLAIDWDWLWSLPVLHILLLLLLVKGRGLWLFQHFIHNLSQRIYIYI